MRKTNIKAEPVKVETIKPVSPQGEIDIVKKTFEDGAVAYYHPAHLPGEDAVKIYCENIYDTMLRPIEKIRGLSELLGDKYWGKWGFIAESICDEADRLYEELAEFLEKSVGVISVDEINRGNIGYRTGRIAGIRIKPKATDSKPEEVPA